MGTDICLQAGKTAQIINVTGNIGLIIDLASPDAPSGHRVQTDSHGRVGDWVISISGKEGVGRLGWG